MSPVWSALVLLFLSGASMYGAMLLLKLSWQEVRGFDALAAGLLLEPHPTEHQPSRTTAVALRECGSETEPSERVQAGPEQAELIALGVSQDVPGLLAGLADVGRARPQS